MANKAKHLLIPAFSLWEGGRVIPASIWCIDAPADEHPNLATTEKPEEVTCKRCINLGGCGPKHK